MKYVNDVVLVFLLLTLNIFHTIFSVSLVVFGQVNVSWVERILYSQVLGSMNMAGYFRDRLQNAIE